MIQIQKISSLPEVINYFSPVSDWLKKFGYGLEHYIQGHNGWIYRGQRDNTWGLIPKAFRDGELNKFIRWYQEKDSLFPQHAQANRLVAEFGAMKNYLEICDRNGLEVNLTYELRKEFNKFIDEINDAIKNKKEFIFPIHFAEVFTLAQHHGVPTRFLDWTFDPLNALFLSAFDYYNNVTLLGKSKETDEISVFAFKSDDVFQHSDITDELQLVPASYSYNTYLKNQAGIFTVDLKQHQKAEDEIDQIKTIERMWNSRSYNNHSLPLLRFDIPGAHVKGLLKIMYSSGYSLTKLMPIHDNASRDAAIFRDLFG
ncbi:FRG domain-containing protein [Leptospira adleri]|uniref:FRG domain-containing protein n=1 Tax=Leptospira adleri TaxID=2023186 RepID=A0ABX4NRX1_9LEPT|nr:FRG domain-containing protein [Leptospira adleri]PJZ59591.1 hypothetical protein CH376_22945 [Leptospira adleri]